MREQQKERENFIAYNVKMDNLMLDNNRKELEEEKKKKQIQA